MTASERNSRLALAYAMLGDAEVEACAALAGDVPPALAHKLRQVLDAIAEASSLTAQAQLEAQRYL